MSDSQSEEAPVDLVAAEFVVRIAVDGTVGQLPVDGVSRSIFLTAGFAEEDVENERPVFSVLGFEMDDVEDMLQFLRAAEQGLIESLAAMEAQEAGLRDA